MHEIHTPLRSPARFAVLVALTAMGETTAVILAAHINGDFSRHGLPEIDASTLHRQLSALVKEGVVVKTRKTYRSTYTSLEALYHDFLVSVATLYFGSSPAMLAAMQSSGFSLGQTATTPR